MLLNEVGEDSIVLCSACDYRANMEAAENIVENISDNAFLSLECIETPNCKTIEELPVYFK